MLDLFNNPYVTFILLGLLFILLSSLLVKIQACSKKQKFIDSIKEELHKEGIFIAQRDSYAQHLIGLHKKVNEQQHLIGSIRRENDNLKKQIRYLKNRCH